MDRPTSAAALVGLDPAHISRRLKAARWLAGGVDDQGRPAPLSADELAQREPLASNGITGNAISEIERMVKRDLRPMLLEKVCEALGLPVQWFAEPGIDWIRREEAVPLDRLLETLERRIEERLSQPPGEAWPTPRPPGELGRMLEGEPTTPGAHQPKQHPAAGGDSRKAADG